MTDLFKSDNYDNNLDSLIKAIKLREIKKINEQYNETVRDLSQALEGFTNEAEDVAKFVIYTDLNNYVEPVNENPSGLFETFRGMLNRIFGRGVPIKGNDIRSFVSDKLLSFTVEKAAEYTNTLRKITLFKERLNALKEILDSERSKKSQEEHKSYEVDLESKTMPKQKKEEQPKEELGGNRTKKKVKRPTMSPPPPPTASNVKKTFSLKEADPSMNELEPKPQEKVATTEKKVHFKSEVEIVPSDSKSELPYSHEDSGYESLSGEEHEYEEISNFQEEKSEVLTKNSQNSKSPREEPIYATVSKEHVEVKRERKQQPEPPKPLMVPPVLDKMSSTDQGIGQKPRAVAKDKPEIPPKPKNLGNTDQKVSTKPKVVEVILEKPTALLKSEDQGHRWSAQKDVGEV